jgi:hypothetical protein
MNEIADLTVANGAGKHDALADGNAPDWGGKQLAAISCRVSCWVCRSALLLFLLSPYSPVLKVYWRIGRITQPKAN